MKKVLLPIIWVIVLLLPYTTSAQSPSNEFFQKYANKEGVTASSIAGFMIKPFVENFSKSLSKGINYDISKVLNKVTSINILQCDSTNRKAMRDLGIEAGKLLTNTKYASLVGKNSKSYTLKIVSFKNKENITEILGFGSDSNSAVLVSVQGNFTEAMINELLSKVPQLKR